MFAKFFRPDSIIGALPVTLTNGTTADATQVMSDLNWIVNQVNANAAPLANTALLNANNNFTAVQSGIAATQAANFPIASQVQNSVLTNLTSTLGTNTITARIAALSLGAYTSGQVFTFIPSQTNTGATTLNVDGLGAKNILFEGQACFGGEIKNGISANLHYDGTQFNILGPNTLPVATNTLTSDVNLSNTGTYFDGPSVNVGSAGRWLVTGSVVAYDTAGVASIKFKLWDGTTVGASGFFTTQGANSPVVCTLSAVFTNPAGNIRMSAQDVSATSGKISYNLSANAKDSTITAVRL